MESKNEVRQSGAGVQLLGLKLRGIARGVALFASWPSSMATRDRKRSATLGSPTFPLRPNGPQHHAHTMTEQDMGVSRHVKVTDWNSTPSPIVEVNMGMRRKFVVLCCTFIPL
jgi:hypothetical protein